MRAACSHCELKLPFAGSPRAALLPSFSNISNIWAPEFCPHPETQLRANLCLLNHLQGKDTIELGEPAPAQTCQGWALWHSEAGVSPRVHRWASHVHRSPSAAFSQKGELPCCSEAALTHAGVTDFQSGQNHSQGALTTVWAAPERTKMLQRKIPKNLLEQRNKATRGKQKRNLRESSYFHGTGKKQPTVTTMKLWLFVQSSKVCISHNEYMDLENYFQIEVPVVEDYVIFQFTCTDHDPATPPVPDPDPGLVSSASLHSEGQKIALRHSFSGSRWRVPCMERNFLVFQIW